ncbi:hypothetical protein ACLMJK_006361 [Lecanora helva]
MLSLLLFTCLYLFQPTTLAATTSQLCSTRIQTSTTPAGYSIYYDNDPTFVYTDENCTSTDQKLINPAWYLGICTPAISAACASTSNDSAITDNWTFGWYEEGDSLSSSAVFASGYR